VIWGGAFDARGSQEREEKKVRKEEYVDSREKGREAGYGETLRERGGNLEEKDQQQLPRKWPSPQEELS